VFDGNQGCYYTVTRAIIASPDYETEERP
jgi:hypothetical protein